MPCGFDTAEEAAQSRALIMKGFKASGDGKVHSPPKQNKPHKTRAKKPLEPIEQPRMPVMPLQMPHMPQMPLPTAMGMPIAYPAPHAPFAAVSPLPMARFACE